MAITVNYSATASEGTAQLGGTQSVSSDTIIKNSYEGAGSNAIPASSTNYQVPLTFVTAKLKAAYLIASATMTLKYNSTSSPAPSITLAAGVPYLWTLASGITSPFTADVTTLYVTSSAGGDLRTWYQVDR